MVFRAANSIAGGVILAVSGLLLAVAIFGATRIVPNTAVIDYFAADSPMRQDYAAVEEAFGASSQIQVMVEGDLSDPVTLQAMLDFQEAVADIQGMGPSTSIATMLQAIHWTLTGEEGLPTTREAVAQELLIYQLSGDPSTISAYMTLDSSLGLIDLATTSRAHPRLRLGVSPRAALHLVRAARAHAALAGRRHVLPDDIQELAVPVLAHRVILSNDAQLARDTAERVVSDLLGEVPVPAGVR